MDPPVHLEREGIVGAAGWIGRYQTDCRQLGSRQGWPLGWAADVHGTAVADEGAVEGEQLGELVEEKVEIDQIVGDAHEVHRSEIVLVVVESDHLAEGRGEGRPALRPIISGTQVVRGGVHPERHEAVGQAAVPCGARAARPCRCRCRPLAPGGRAPNGIGIIVAAAAAAAGLAIIARDDLTVVVVRVRVRIEQAHRIGGGPGGRRFGGGGSTGGGIGGGHHLCSAALREMKEWAKPRRLARPFFIL